MTINIRVLSDSLCQWLSNIVDGDGLFLPDKIESWKEPDWDVAKIVVYIHGVGAIWGNLCIRGWRADAMSTEFREYLIGEYYGNKERVEKIHKIYKEIESKLIENGIKFLPFKGIDLANRIYSDPALRPMADVDLYIGHENKTLALNTIESLGFILGGTNKSGANLYSKQLLNAKKNTASNIQDDPINRDYKNIGENINSALNIDVHFDMAGSSLLTKFDQSMIFENARLSDDAKLSQEDYFIYLLLHAAKHFIVRCGRWLHLSDINNFLNTQAVNKRKILDRADELGIAHLLLIPLILCRQNFSDFDLELEQSLFKIVGWRHKRLFKKMNLTEMSCCNPWGVASKEVFYWSKDIQEIWSLVSQTLGHRKHTKIRRAEKLIAVPKLSKRIIHRIKSRLSKKARITWGLFESYGLDAKIDWK